jgi:putative spermidine/putrescine transport system ATP-binding protein
VIVSVRPERARLVEPGGSAEVSVSGTLRQTIYVGDHLRLVVSLAGGQEFVLKVANATGQQATFMPGQPVRVGWAVADGLALMP